MHFTADVITYFYVALFQNEAKKYVDEKRALKCSATSETAFYCRRDNILLRGVISELGEEIRR